MDIVERNRKAGRILNPSPEKLMGPDLYEAILDQVELLRIQHEVRSGVTPRWPNPEPPSEVHREEDRP
jgi:hypothetical protein